MIEDRLTSGRRGSTTSSLELCGRPRCDNSAITNLRSTHKCIDPLHLEVIPVGDFLFKVGSESQVGIEHLISGKVRHAGMYGDERQIAAGGRWHMEGVSLELAMLGVKWKGTSHSVSKQ